MFRAIADLIVEHGSKLPIKQWIGGRENPYVERRKLVPKNPLVSLYLHNIKRSDDPTAPHNHRSFTVSLILRGGYVELLYDRDGYVTASKWRGRGSLIFRTPWSFHRLVIDETRPDHTWSLFLTGPTIHDWGFFCRDKGYVRWQDFTAGINGELIGRGCD